MRGTAITADTDWGTNGAWTGPPEFGPSDLLVDPNGGLVCVGWTTVPGGVEFTAIRIADDGRSDSPFVSTGSTPQPNDFLACVDSAGGLLVARTAPNPLSVFLQGLAAVGAVARWNPDGTPDAGFGPFGGVCFAQHLGYPVTVRGLACTNAGFFLATDRPASIDPQFSHTRAAIFAFDIAGRPVGTFGETGIVLHDDIPCALQLHDASSAIAVGTRRVWGSAGAPDEFELAVTTTGSAGNVVWTYGTTHGLQSGPVVINGQRPSFYVNAVVRWGGLLAIGGGFVGPGVSGGFVSGGFVTIRNFDGRLLQGTTTLVQTTFPIDTLEALPNGALDATYRIANGTFEKMRLVNTPALMIDTTFPPTAVSRPFPQLNLADGSTIRPKWAISTFFSPHSLTLWLTREPPGAAGTIDPAYGGGAGTTPTGRYVDVTDPAFTVISLATVAAFITLPNGLYFLLVVISAAIGGNLPEPVGAIATAWNANDGSPAWTNPLLLRGFFPSQVVIDDTDVVLVGAAETQGTNLSRAATLMRLRTANGTLDPGFGIGGILRVPLRGDRYAQHQTAQAILDLPNGPKIVPVIFKAPPRAGDPTDDQRFQLSFAWLDIT